MWWLLLTLLRCYVAVVLGPVIATSLLILFGAGWGPVPHLLIWLLRKAFVVSPCLYPRADEAPWPGIIERSSHGRLQRHKHGSGASFGFSSLQNAARSQANDASFMLTSSALVAGFEAIVQDELSCCFYPAPVYRWNWLSRPWFALSHAQTFVYCLGIVVRFAVLTPIRLCLLIFSFIFVGVCALIPLVYTFNKSQRVYIGVTYCRLFCAGLGLVATYHGFDEHRPRKGGICMSNHLSPNDIQIIFSNVPYDSDTSYTVTGQKHSGIIWFIERTVSELCSALWFERSVMKDRNEFMNAVLKYAADPESDPVLLFPEGYCTNNTRVLQFRKALFESPTTPIYPIALRQDAALGDHFWGDCPFWMYLLKVMTSWAIVYDVHHLPKMNKFEDETSTEFARRVQSAICTAAGIDAVTLDGNIWWREAERSKLFSQQQFSNAEVFRTVLATKNISDGDDSD